LTTKKSCQGNSSLHREGGRGGKEKAVSVSWEQLLSAAERCRKENIGCFTRREERSPFLYRKEERLAFHSVSLTREQLRKKKKRKKRVLHFEGGEKKQKGRPDRPRKKGTSPFPPVKTSRILGVRGKEKKQTPAEHRAPRERAREEKLLILRFDYQGRSSTRKKETSPPPEKKEERSSVLTLLPRRGRTPLAPRLEKSIRAWVKSRKRHGLLSCCGE